MITSGLAPVAAGRPASEIVAWSRTAVEPALRAAVESLPAALGRVAGYHLGWWDEHGRAGAAGGGKALRPAVVLSAAVAVGGAPEPAVPAAVAVELVHNFSLLHDDVMDGDDTRRHRLTAWAVFGRDAAILTGDALLALALDVLAAADPAPSDGGRAGTPPTRALAGAVQRLLAGQSADLEFERVSTVDMEGCRQMARDKTAALLGCAAGLGAQFGGGTAAQVEALSGYGEQLGLAFQLIDDLLGIWGDPAITGKPVHSDLRSAKKTFPVVAALTSGTAAGLELRDRLRRPARTDDRELHRLADLIDQAGGRLWAEREADRLLGLALDHLDSAGPTQPAGAELQALAAYATAWPDLAAAAGQ